MPDATDATTCSITVVPVPGATTYFAIYTGSADFSAISFDKATQTFSGLNIGQTQWQASSLTSANGALTMAGKTSTTSIVMKPCLSLVKFQMKSTSVASNYDSGGYSGVRGFNLMLRKSGSRIVCAGDYTVNLSGSEMAVSYVDNANKKDYKQLSNGTLLSASTDYYLSIIPTGTTNKVELQFLGFKSDGTTYTWGSDAKDYKLSIEKTINIKPGECLDFGILDPVGMKKAADEAAASLVNNINNVDWTGSGVETATYSGTSYPQLSELKVIADQNFVYVRVAAPASTFDANYLDFYVADSGTANSVYWPWTTKCTNSYNVEHAGALTSSSLTIAYNSISVETKTETVNGTIYWYMSLPRTAHAITTPDGTVSFGIRIWKDWDMVGLLPINGSAMLSVTLP